MMKFSALRQTLGTGFAALVLLSCTQLVIAQASEIQEASKLMRAGQHQQALERVNKVLAARPRDAQARFLKGLIFAEQGNSKEASEIFLSLTKDYPELPEPYNNLAVIYAATGQYEKARAALEQSIRTHPSYATAYENLGDVYSKLASQAYDKALQIDSGNSAAKNKLALVRELVGGSGGAAVAAAPTKPSAPVVVAQNTSKEPAKEAPKAPEKVAAAPAPAPKEPAKETAKEPAKVAAAEPKPAAEKPAPKKSAAGGGDALDAVNGWAKAWSSQNADAYLAYYAKDFKTPGGESRDDWEKGRRQRIAAPKSIAVSVGSPKVSIEGSQARVTFRQTYKSDVMSTTSTKTLILVRADGRWLIQQEKVGN